MAAQTQERTAPRQTITGNDPHAPIAVPDDRKFDDGDQLTYLDAPDLSIIGRALIDAHEEFAHLRGVGLDYYWRRKGGSSGVKRTFGECVKASDLLRNYTDVRFVVWVAADHARDVGLAAIQLEALLYHLLSHTERHERGYWRLRAHDFEGFNGELDRYGAWQSDLHAMAEKIIHVDAEGVAVPVQMRKLPGMEKEDYDVGDPSVDEAIHQLRLVRQKGGDRSAASGRTLSEDDLDIMEGIADGDDDTADQEAEAQDDDTDDTV